MPDIEGMRKAIREEGLDGWLFCNFRHRDSLTDRLLGLSGETSASRRWCYFVPATGEPRGIVHAIEPDALAGLPGTREPYLDAASFRAALATFAGLNVAALADPDLPVLSTMDAATWLLATQAGISLESAAPLVQRVLSLLSPADRESHEAAAQELYRLVRSAWDRVRSAFRSGTAVHEGDIQDFLLDGLTEAGLVTDHPPIVAAGANSALPHYEVPGHRADGPSRGKRLERGDVVQLDIWAKKADGIYADISWVGYIGPDPEPAHLRAFDAIVAARDRVVGEVDAALAEGRPITGAELDRVARRVIGERGLAEGLRHRTGHGIDRECHGMGVNLDSVEFPDSRLILEGSCFSVEPGVYFEDFGMRTEIDVYVSRGRAVVSGPGAQRRIMTVEDFACST